MKMVTRVKSASRGNIDVQLRQCPDVQTCLCLVCTFPQPILNSNNKSPFFLFTSHAYSWHFHVLSQCLHRSWHFQYKIFTLPLIILLSLPFVFTSCFYGFEYSEHNRMGSGCLNAWAPRVILIPEEKKKMLRLTNVGNVTLNVTCSWKESL